jgi:NMT1-like family
MALDLAAHTLDTRWTHVRAAGSSVTGAVSVFFVSLMCGALAYAAPPPGTPQEIARMPAPREAPMPASIPFAVPKAAGTSGAVAGEEAAARTGSPFIAAQAGPSTALPSLVLPPAASTDPPLFASLMRMGDVAMVRGDVPRARALYERAASLHPSSSAAHIAAGKTYDPNMLTLLDMNSAGLADTAKAREWYERALSRRSRRRSAARIPQVTRSTQAKTEQTMNRRALLAIAAAGLTAPVVARAQQGSSAVAKANANVIGVISGGLDGTYTRFAADLAAVLDDIDGLRIVPMIGKGSFQNLSDLLYMRGVDVAIVQSDVLAAAEQQNVFPRMAQQVQYIAKLYDEEVHVFARPGVERLSDLAGKLVAMDNRGSGTAMTATLLFSASASRSSRSTTRPWTRRRSSGGATSPPWSASQESRPGSPRRCRRARACSRCRSPKACWRPTYPRASPPPTTRPWCRPARRWKRWRWAPCWRRTTTRTPTAASAWCAFPARCR